MNKHKSHLVRLGVALVTLIFALNSCNDTWENHYEIKAGDVSNTSIWYKISTNDSLSDFREVVEKTYLYVKDRKTLITYANILDSDQSYTVWAPVNGTFNNDSLLTLLETEAGGAQVETGFLMNHMARYPYSITPTTDEMVVMMNQKLVSLNDSVFGKVRILSPNTLLKNGILHLIDGNVPFLANIYEWICLDPETSQLSSFLKAFQIDSLDEFSSVASGIVDGRTVYVDSVLIKNNALLSQIGDISEEDSTFWFIAPTNTAWDSAYSKVSSYYNYVNVDNADSLKSLWTKTALIYDLVYNPRMQKSIQDSLTSTRYKPWDPLYHVYYNPKDAGGILSNVKETRACSNGTIFTVDNWPFNPKDIFFKPITIDATNESNIQNYALSSINIRNSINDSLKVGRYLDLVPVRSSSNPTIIFDVANTLSGKYDINVVCVPKTAFMTPANAADSSTAFLPFKFKATLTYVDEKGRTKTNNFNSTNFFNDPYKVDTLCIAKSFQFPTCNYNQTKTSVNLKLQVFVLSSETGSYSREMFLDCIYLKPSED